MKKQEPIKYSKSKDKELFPHETMIWRLEDRREKKLCWFQCYEHVEKYIIRYKLTKVQYKLQVKV